MSQQPGEASPGRVALDRVAPDGVVPDRIALVSGGSRGIGAAVVRKLVASLLAADAPAATGRVLEVPSAISF